MEGDSKMVGEFLIPIWTGDTAYEESVMAVENEDGSISPIQLLHPATEIIEVQSLYLGTVYTEGVDYTLTEEGDLVILRAGSILITTYKEIHLDSELPGKSFQKDDGGYLRFSENGFFHKRQIQVTYRYESEWYGEIPKRQGAKLPKTHGKLTNKEPMHVVVFGDSITNGGNTSGALNLPPYLPKFANIIVDEWKREYGYEDIRLTNTSVGGKDSFWGVEEANERVGTYAPDLLVIGFGMNGRATPEEYKENIEKIMAVAKKANPNCEFVLIATMLPNKILPYFVRKQPLYLEPLLQIASEQGGVAVADMTTMHRDLLKRKAFIDMTGNNVNHTNDYLTRVYAQVILETVKK